MADARDNTEHEVGSPAETVEPVPHRPQPPEPELVVVDEASSEAPIATTGDGASLEVPEVPDVLAHDVEAGSNGAAASTPLSAQPIVPSPPPPPPPGVAYPSTINDEPMAHLMTYSEHLVELRERLIKCTVALAVAIAISFLFTNTIFDILKSRSAGVTLIRTGVAEMIGTYFKVAVLTGVILAMPVWLYQIMMFVAPGMTRQERRYLFAALPGIIASFVIGVLFGYFVLLPPALNFLIHFGEDIALPLIRVGDYVSVVTSLLFWIGVIFETPLVIFILARLGVVTPKLLAQHRKHAAVGAFVIAAVITPTVDPVNQTLVAGPLILLYELGIQLARLAVRARNG